MLKQLRAFDVCLMVFVLGLAAGKKTITGYKEYIRKRTQRLFFFGLDSPCRLFLIFYVAYHTGIVFDFYKVETVIYSFLLHNGIGYIWI